MRAGITIDADEEGTGPVAERGNRITVSYTLTLNRGDVVQAISGYSFTLGKRQVIAGLEYGIEGMRAGGKRKFHASPHLCYGDKGVEGKIPPNAVLHFEVQLLVIEVGA